MGTPASPVVADAVAQAHRREWAFVLAATVRVTRDIDLAEECVQDAYARALEHWARDGVPAIPGAWLTTVARRRALDLRRRNARFVRSLPLLADDRSEAETAFDEPHEVADDRLRLIFTCCHPALATPAQVALTLRLLCGLSTTEIAQAFLVSEPTMAARITRAKKKIAAARIPYRVPDAQELPERIEAVLSVVHLVFTTGHTAPAGGMLVRDDLVARSLELARMLRLLLAADGEVAGLLALIILTDARSATRVSEQGELALLGDQDRSRWNRAAIAEGAALAQEALLARPPGRYALMAAIAALHAGAPSFEQTDWAEIVGLYDRLAAVWPSPVVALNRAAAIGFAEGPRAGLLALDALSDEPALDGYRYLAAARADFLRRLGRDEEARNAYAKALALTENEVERAFLRGRLATLQV
jgi:RNA polymerase sigma-70 factor (ECF subfamily)